jgi:hypothetical protein
LATTSRYAPAVDRVVLVARLQPGSQERAQELLAQKASSTDEPAFDRVTTYLSESEVVFVLEGDDVDESVRAIFNDPVASTVISPWLALFDGPLHGAREVFAWERERARPG